ncbi:hypothetical protein NF27_HS00190 [Candidatus Jidaibacter acanthamoeba]|uniref:Uncharacterized protein n=1 Tax=Candidatus Jidaibacter acanthamoebae TaxID=86105 RepID=A0A0C1MQZ6_9RICK|nr:hypothetical protein [Candidatus Jidaibacter acanthamoeba]KIE04432.1 hypothetical protein NF27_HS00190 [Candidatus Jidaibacter acanthamoeba]
MTTSISFSSNTNIINSAKIDNNQDQSGSVLSGKEIHPPIEFKWVISDFVWDLSNEEVAKKTGEAIDAAIERVKALRSQINIKKFIYDSAAMEIENENVVLGVPDRSASGILEGLATVLGVPDRSASGILDGLIRMKELTMQAAMGSSSPNGRWYYHNKFEQLVDEQERLVKTVSANITFTSYSRYK